MMEDQKEIKVANVTEQTQVLDKDGVVRVGPCSPEYAKWWMESETAIRWYAPFTVQRRKVIVLAWNSIQ